MQKSLFWPRKFACSATTWPSRQYLVLTIPERKNSSTVMYAFRSRFLAARMRTFSPPRQTSKILPNEKMRLALVLTGQRRIPEASPHDKLWGIGLSACDPESTNDSTVKCATLATISCKKIANISSREATLRHSHKKMRYALPLDILANAASPKLALMINCSAPA